ncbi:Rhodanese-like protein [Polychaeton citri CBS 116435]|uniref:Rhodanese-like protein n=1 Tax=Polychaeton citri CBS 116435 TaxID=1314669 RepID=A0A9P4PY86_9PEZI|nr:Rhodanese-like protein [Polychaeton citri CBS 116435]
MAAIFASSRPPLLSSLARTFRPVVFRTAGTVRRQSTMKSYIISPSELDSALQANAPSKLSTAPRTVPVCGSWFMPNDPQKRTGHEVFKQRHIPKSVFFDLDKVADTSSPYPHMLPSAEVFKEAMESLGISKDDTVVVYDSAELGIFSAPRVAWTFRVFGHHSVHLLDNFKLWVEQGYPVEEGEAKSAQRSSYPLPTLDKSKVVDFEEMKEIARDHNKEGAEPLHILDARSLGRWKGTDPEPRPGLSSGHIPRSTSVPMPELLDPETKSFLPPEELQRIFKEKGVDPNLPIISSCGTGVTATIIDTALIQAGYGEGVRRIYDGSWTEWAQRVQASENLIKKVAV